jgi:hypothetical protein
MEKKYTFLTDKKKKFNVRITTTVKGRLKNEIMDDCIYRNMMEAQVSRNIFEIYYSIMSERPDLSRKEFREIKTEILKRMKLKPIKR